MAGATYQLRNPCVARQITVENERRTGAARVVQPPSSSNARARKAPPWPGPRRRGWLEPPARCPFALAHPLHATSTRSLSARRHTSPSARRASTGSAGSHQSGHRNHATLGAPGWRFALQVQRELRQGPGRQRIPQPSPPQQSPGRQSEYIWCRLVPRLHRTTVIGASTVCLERIPRATSPDRSPMAPEDDCATGRAHERRLATVTRSGSTFVGHARCGGRGKPRRQAGAGC